MKKKSQQNQNNKQLEAFVDNFDGWVKEIGNRLTSLEDVISLLAKEVKDTRIYLQKAHPIIKDIAITKYKKGG